MILKAVCAFIASLPHATLSHRAKRSLQKLCPGMSMVFNLFFSSLYWLQNAFFCLKVTFIYFCGVWMWGGVQVCVGQRTAYWS